jgi:autotransporter-associated beta strand protein
VILGNWTGDPCTAEYDLNGGTLITPNVYNVNSSGGVLVAPNGSAVFKFNGGVLQGTQNDNQGDPQVVAEGSTNLMGNLTHAYVQAGGAKINAGTFNCGINQSLEHDPAMGATMDGGLTVQGAGTLTLYRPSTYTGPTKVQGGVLACATNTALGGGSLDISTGGSVALNYSGTRTISQLTFNAGSPQPNGTYGATGSGATTIDNTHFSGTGTVTVTPPVPPTPVWSSSAITMSGGVPTFTFATVAGYKYRLVYKNNLTDASWTVVINPPNYPSPDGWGAVSTGTPATISDPGAVGQSKRFYRVEVANP